MTDSATDLIDWDALGVRLTENAAWFNERYEAIVNDADESRNGLALLIQELAGSECEQIPLEVWLNFGSYPQQISTLIDKLLHCDAVAIAEAQQLARIRRLSNTVIAEADRLLSQPLQLDGQQKDRKDLRP